MNSKKVNSILFYNKIPILIFLILKCAFVQALETENTFIESKKIEKEAEQNRYFIEGQLGHTTFWNSGQSIGARLGYQFDYLGIDVSATRIVSNWSALKIKYCSCDGADPTTTFNPNAEILKMREQSDVFEIYKISPGINLISQLPFDSENWKMETHLGFAFGSATESGYSNSFWLYGLEVDLALWYRITNSKANWLRLGWSQMWGRLTNKSPNNQNLVEESLYIRLSEAKLGLIREF